MLSKPDGQGTEAGGRQLEADGPLTSTSKEEPGLHWDLRAAEERQEQLRTKKSLKRKNVT